MTLCDVTESIDNHSLTSGNCRSHVTSFQTCGSSNQASVLAGRCKQGANVLFSGDSIFLDNYLAKLEYQMKNK